MSRLTITKYTFVFFLLTNDIIKLFDHVENKILDDICQNNKNIRNETMFKITNELKPRYRNYIFKNSQKKGEIIYNSIGNRYNRNNVKKKLYQIHFFGNNFGEGNKKVIQLRNAKGKTSYAHFWGNDKKGKGEKNAKLADRERHTLDRPITHHAHTAQFLFIDLYTSYKNRGNSRSFKRFLRKYEELYQKFTAEGGEENDKDDTVAGRNSDTPSPVTINDWCLHKNGKEYNATLLYDYISNMHNTEYQDIGNVNNFIKNNQLIEKEEWEKKKKTYLTYKHKFKYKNVAHKKSSVYEGEGEGEGEYKYEYHIPKLETYEEDISTEPKFVPSNFNSPKCYANSPINALTTSGFSSRNIDTFGKERNKIYSFNTPTDVKRNIYFTDLMRISSSYNQHFFPNLTFLLNLHTLQILIRDKTAIETDYIIDKFDQLKKRLTQISLLNSKGINSKPGEKPPTSENSSGHYKKRTEPISSIEMDTQRGMKRLENDTNHTEKEKEGESHKNTTLSSSNVIENEQIDSEGRKENSEANEDMEKEIMKHLTHKKSLFDDQLQIFKNKYSDNILEDKKFMNLWKFDEKGEIVEKLNKIPIPKIYLHIDHPKYCLWKILQNSGKNAFIEIPTPNRKLEAWRQQVNLKKFYKNNFDTSISLRRISKEELDNFRMKTIGTPHQEGEQLGKRAIEDSTHGKKSLHEGGSNDEGMCPPLDSSEYYELQDEPGEESAAVRQKHVEDEDVKGNEFRTDALGKVRTSNFGDEAQINECKKKHQGAFYTLVVRDGIVDELLSDDVNILRELDNQLKKSEKQTEEEKNGTTEMSSDQVGEEKRKKSKIFVGSFFNINDAEVEYLINNELYFIPEHSNWYKKNSQPFIRGQIGKQSRKFDNDYPIYDYRKSDFGMAKFSSLNLASIKDCAVVFLDKDIDLSHIYIHVIFIATSKNEDEGLHGVENEYSVYENAPSGEQSEGTSTGGGNAKEEAISGEAADCNANQCDESLHGMGKRKYEEKELTNYTYNPITNPRLVVYVKGNSKINVYESHISLNKNNGGLVNAFSRIVLEEKSNVKHILSQELGKNVWHFHNVSVKNGLNGNYKFVDVLLGSLSSRVNIQIEGEKGCKQESYGLSLLEDKQNISQYEMFHHEHPFMETNQLFKFLVSDKAHAVWRSRGRIERDAIKAKLNTLCRSVLLNFGASAVAIPTLEIIPSDIEGANHGATISDLEEEPIFSLMTRGITEKVARKIMMKAFVNEILEHIPDDNLKGRVYQKVLNFSEKYKKTPHQNFRIEK
ncbi:FeS cluster assembly protein SufD, putative [Plasmodium ovale]|uniref:FeS cluster assembly protein SufD, putative n=1 Tax=Plasmodium ovale TaxID=36330 RepID=A0A1C3KS28_PLAOA|nr:FeS cluster assembly protein SufD, putative [Plasmodium ovale]